MDPSEQPRSDASNETADRDTDKRVGRDWHTVRFGLVTIGVSIPLLLMPLLIGGVGVNRFLVLFGLLAMCVGVGCVLHGALDWLITTHKR